MDVRTVSAVQVQVVQVEEEERASKQGTCAVAGRRKRGGGTHVPHGLVYFFH